MRRVGLTGGTGAGKSTVASFLRHHGVPVLDADRMAHELYAPGSSLLMTIAEEFGEQYITEKGALDRPALGKLVFENAAELEKLNRIVHPPLLAKIEEGFEQLEADGNDLAVLEAALILKWGRLEFLDAVVGVVANRWVRLKRLMASGLDEDAAKARLDAQVDDDTIRQQCDYIIENEGSLLELEAQVTDFLAWIENRED